MATYLSDQWIAEANDALSSLAPSAEAGSIGYRIEERSVEYTLVLGPDRCGMQAGLSDADVVLILNYATATGIATHDLSAQREFLNGSMRIDGDVNVLMTSSEQASKAAKLLGKLETEYPDP